MQPYAWGGRGVAVIVLLTALLSLVPRGIAAEEEDIAFLAFLQESLSDAQSRLFVNAGRMGYILHARRSDGGYHFVHVRPEKQILNEALKGTRASTDEFVAGDILLSAGVGGATKDGKVTFGVKALVLGYAKGRWNRIYNKVAELCIPVMGDLMSRMEDKSGESDAVPWLQKLETNLGETEVAKRFEAYHKGYPHLVGYLNAAKGVAVIRQPIADLGKVQEFLEAGSLDDRFGYVNPVLTATIFWSQNGGRRGTDMFYLPGIAISKQTYEAKKKDNTEGFPGALNANDKLKDFFKTVILEILNAKP